MKGTVDGGKGDVRMGSRVRTTLAVKADLMDGDVGFEIVVILAG